MTKKILVLDSREALLDVISRLQREQYEVITCSFNAEAFKCIKDVQPHVVVIDLSRPDLPGLDLISIIKTDPTLSVTPLVVCTSPTPDVEQTVQQLAKMRLYVVRAPCSADDLIAKIKEALGEA